MKQKRLSVLIFCLVAGLLSFWLFTGATELTDSSSMEFYRAAGSSPMDLQVPVNARKRIRALRELRVAFSSTTPPNGLAVIISGGSQSLEYTVYANASGTSVTYLVKQFDPPHLVSSDQTIEIDWTKTSGGTDAPTWQVEAVLTTE